MERPVELTIMLPCRNEELALPFVLNQINEVVNEKKIDAEVLISESSSDNSLNVIKEFVRGNEGKLKVRVVRHNKEGYGNAYLEAFDHVNGDYIFMADCDGSYDFSEIPNFLKKLKEGNDFVIGDRFNDIEEGAMPFSNRYIGNPLLSGILRILFKTRIRDSHCGMRAIKSSSLKKLKLKTTGMEFASEMVVKALKNNLRIKQVPISYKKRIGNSKLKKYSDAWRHLRFMLLYSPLFLFLIPGLFLFAIGFVTLFLFYFRNPVVLGFTFYTHPMFLSSLLTIVGYQLIIFSVFAKTYAVTHLGEESSLEKFYKYVTLETGSLAGLLVIFFGFALFVLVLNRWISSDFGSLNEIKNSVIALTLIVLGIQTIFSSFMLSILGIRER